jgi:hypothetical protein
MVILTVLFDENHLMTNATEVNEAILVEKHSARNKSYRRSYFNFRGEITPLQILQKSSDTS